MFEQDTTVAREAQEHRQEAGVGEVSLELAMVLA